MTLSVPLPLTRRLRKLAVLSADRLARIDRQSRMQALENRSCPHCKPYKSFKPSTAHPMLAWSTAPSSETAWRPLCGATTTTPGTTRRQRTIRCRATSLAAPVRFAASGPTPRGHRTNSASCRPGMNRPGSSTATFASPICISALNNSPLGASRYWTANRGRCNCTRRHSSTTRDRRIAFAS